MRWSSAFVLASGALMAVLLAVLPGAIAGVDGAPWWAALGVVGAALLLTVVVP
jgi:hypothetical protein